MARRSRSDAHLGPLAQERLLRLAIDARKPGEIVWAGSVYGGVMHAIRDTKPARWEEAWMHAAACGMSTPRGGWQPGTPTARRCPVCMSALMATGVNPNEIKVRVA